MTTEMTTKTKNGWSMFPLLLGLLLLSIAGTVWSIVSAAQAGHAGPGVAGVVWIIAMVLVTVAFVVMMCGFFTLQPNEAAVLILFGEYKGTSRTAGFAWANPFLTKKKVSLRARTLNGQKLKVNDQRGNPIEIANVVVWRVEDTSRAVFDVNDYNTFVETQSEAALRHLASRYPYDLADEQTVSLRGNIDDVSRALQIELQERLAKAGVIVDEARLSHLAYAPEIAGAMLRRQQAEAVVAARSRIVEGAVGMVQHALAHLERDKIVELDSERKAAMVSNLLVVLCGEHAAQPVVNTGTLYQ